MDALITLLAQIDLPGLGQEGPDDLQRYLSAFYAMFGLGFLLGIAGHVIKSRLLVGIGIALVFASTAVFLIAVGEYG